MKYHADHPRRRVRRGAHGGQLPRRVGRGDGRQGRAPARQSPAPRQRHDHGAGCAAASLLLTDGPFAEAKEQMAGFDVVECANLDEAIEVASKQPVTRFGAIEVRIVSGRSERRAAGRWASAHRPARPGFSAGDLRAGGRRRSTSRRTGSNLSRAWPTRTAGRRRPWCAPAWPRTCIAASAKRSIPDAPIGFDDRHAARRFTGRSPSRAVAPDTVIVQPSFGGEAQVLHHIGSNQLKGTYTSATSISPARVVAARLPVTARRRTGGRRGGLT